MDLTDGKLMGLPNIARDDLPAVLDERLFSLILTNLKFIGKHYDMNRFNLEVTKFTSHLPTSGQILFQDIFGIGRKSGIIYSRVNEK